MAEGTKNDKIDSPYVQEDSEMVKNTRFAWAKTRGVKISAIVAAGTLALGATFALGATLGKNIGPGPERQFGNHAPFDRDAAGQSPFAGKPDGHHGRDGKRGADRDGDNLQPPADPNAPANPSIEMDGETVNP